MVNPVFGFLTILAVAALIWLQGARPGAIKLFVGIILLGLALAIALAFIGAIIGR